MRQIVTVVLISSALATTTPAVAADRASGIARADRTAQKRIDRLQREVRRATVRSRRARRQLAVTNARLNTRTAERDQARAALASTTQERDEALAALATRTQERDQANATVATLSGHLAARNAAPLEAAVEQVRREVEYSEKVLQGTGASYSREALIAHAAMSYVAGHVSAPAYGWLNEIADIQLTPTANGVLAAGAGICGHAALTFAAIVKRFGLTVRSVQFYYEAGNHIANEVWYDGAWHYWDPTWGAYYQDGDRVMSMSEARDHPDPESLLRHNRTLFWYGVAEIGGISSLTNLSVHTDPATRVEYGKQPFPE